MENKDESSTEPQDKVASIDAPSPSSSDDEDEEEAGGGMTNAYSVSDLLGELDEVDNAKKSASLKSNKSAQKLNKDLSDKATDLDLNKNLPCPSAENLAQSGDKEVITCNNGSVTNNTEEKSSPQDCTNNTDPDPESIGEGTGLYHSPTEVLQRKRESLLREEGRGEGGKGGEHTYYNQRDWDGEQGQGPGQGQESGQGVPGDIPAPSLPERHDYYNVVNPTYRDEHLYNDVPQDNPYYNHENQSGNPQSDIYENIQTGEAGSSEAGTEDDWASDEFEDYESSYQSTSSGRGGRGGRGPPTLPPRNEAPGDTKEEQPLPPAPSMFNKLAARLAPHRSTSRTEEPEEEEPGMLDVMLNLDKHPIPELPPPPSSLDSLQLTRRHIVSSIVDSEVSYTASLRTLVKDYEKPLAAARPEIISRKALRTIFYKVKEILQCHNMFHIELAECVRVWDEKETIGNIFTASFSKSIVFEAYSEFVNNFSLAMETAKKQNRTKQAFSDFLKHKISTSSDKLSLFGLMVKPVQRFPQFIMLLQDLLKQTPRNHHDRLPLQMALTELENLTHKLNETKRESESRHEARRIIANMTGRFSLKPELERFLVRQDDLLQIDVVNGDTRTKERRLLLLNDHVVCASVVVKETDVGTSEAKYKIKWAVPVSEIELVEASVPAPYQVQVGRGKTTVTAVRNKELEKSGSPSQHPFKKELDDIFHDLPVIEHIGQLVGQLRLRYEGITPECMNGLVKTLQLMIQQKCDVDKCIIRISIPAKYQAKSAEKLRNEVSKQMNNMKRKHAVHPASPKRGTNRLTFTFQTDSPTIKHDWLLELQNTKLALDPKNNPGWFVPENEMMFAFKLPLFIRPLLIDITKQDTKVQCAIPVLLPGEAPGVGVQHLWVCSGAEGKGQVTIVSLHTNQPHAVESFVACDTTVTCCTAVPGLSHCDDPFSFCEDTVWMGTNDNKIIIRSVTEEQRSDSPRQVITVESPIICIQYLDTRVYAGLKNGMLLIYSRNMDGVWSADDKEMLYLGDLPVSCLLIVNNQMWASSGGKVHVISITSQHVEGNYYRDQFDLESHALGTDGTIECMVTAGVGLLVSFRGKSVIQLYHLETFEHLQDVSVSSNISRVFEGTDLDFWVVSITCLLACRGLLWVGTNIGVVLTLPLPRLEGVPQVRGRPNVSYHAHTGPIKFLSPIQCGGLPIPAPVISQPESYPASEVSIESDPMPDPRHGDPEDAGEQRFSQSADFTSSPSAARVTSQNGLGKWTSTPDLRHVELEDNDVASLYGSLLRVDEELEQEIVGAKIRRRPRAPHINLHKQVTRISEAVSNRISGAHAHNPKSSTLPILHEEIGDVYIPRGPHHPSPGPSPRDSPKNCSSKPSGDSSESQSVSSDSGTVTTIAGTTDSSCSSNSSSREPVRPAPSRPGLPTYPGLHSHLVHSKACIVLSGGEGHVNWSHKKAADSRYEDICLLLWNCRL